MNLGAMLGTGNQLKWKELTKTINMLNDISN